MQATLHRPQGDVQSRGNLLLRRSSIIMQRQDLLEMLGQAQNGTPQTVDRFFSAQRLRRIGFTPLNVLLDPFSDSQRVRFLLAVEPATLTRTTTQVRYARQRGIRWSNSLSSISAILRLPRHFSPPRVARWANNINDSCTTSLLSATVRETHQCCCKAASCRSTGPNTRHNFSLSTSVKRNAVV